VVSHHHTNSDVVVVLSGTEIKCNYP